ncbi:MAG: DUF4838 domain-containing protein [Prolixibacteraceae bacterium]|nr:DUF4838 domain-containing protein [Prolixibacteraceae bacterium]
MTKHAHNLLSGILLSISLMWSAISFGTIHNDRLTIGTKGNITKIIIPENSDETIKFAAAELQDYLFRITGSRLLVKKAGTEKANLKAIRLSLKNDSTLKWDGFRIITDKQNITIESAFSRGLLYGVYQILEDAGCSFVYLNKEEEIVPRLKKIEFSKGIRVFNPRIEHRGLVPDGLDSTSVELGRDFIDWMAKNKLNYILVSVNRPSDSPGSALGIMWKDVEKELLPELLKRDFVIEMSEHCTHEFFPRSLFTEHPDWFALVKGKRSPGNTPYSGQMCYSNPDAVDFYADALANYAACHPEMHTIGTWPLDGPNYCECEGCRDPQTIFRAVTRIAEKIKEVRPDMIVEHLAYQPQTWEPPYMEQLPDNISVLWCPNPGSKDGLARKWVQKARNAGGVYQFEYYLGDNFRSMANLWLRPQYAANAVEYATDMEFRGVISIFLPLDNWWRSCFNNWFFAKACWDTKPDVDAWLNDYYQKYYGNSTGEVKEIFNKIFTELQPEPYRRMRDKEFVDRIAIIEPVANEIEVKLDELISKSSDSVINKRLLRLKTYIEFFSLYSRFSSDRKKESLEKLVEYSRKYPEQNMVLMYPEFITWRIPFTQLD